MASSRSRRGRPSARSLTSGIASLRWMTGVSPAGTAGQPTSAWPARARLGCSQEPMSQLVFDESRARQMQTLYRTRDVRRRRALVREALAARAGERVLDVGCGPGFFVEELLDEVGPDGAVVGVDT